MPRVRTGACALALGVIAAATASAAPAPSSGGWIVYPRYAPSDAGAQILSASVRGRQQRLLVRGASLAAGVALSRNGKRIAFVRKGPGGPAVWVSRADGRGARRVARGAYPGWSPDGRWVVFLGGRRLMTVRVDGSQLRELVRADKSLDVQPVWSPAGGWIAYVAPNLELWIVRPDGTQSRRAASIGRSNSRIPFSWSPNGRRLVYVDTAGYFSTVAVSGGRPRRLPGRGIDPQWSPDGRLIAFTENSTTFVVRADRRSPPRLVAGGDAATWSPDGSKLALAVGNQVWVARVDRRGAWRVSRGRPFSESSGIWGRPAWTPDGRRIFFSREHLDPGRLMVISAAGDRGRRLTPLNRLAETDPSWSPDGRTVAFTGWLEGERGGPDVYLIQADGTRMRRLTPAAWSTANPTWSPNGKQVVFMRWIKPKWVLFAMPAAGGEARRIAALERGNPAWAPGQSIAVDGIELLSPAGVFEGRITQPQEWGYDHEPDWAPDGRHFAFTRVRKGCGPQCAFSYLTVGEFGSMSAQQTEAEVTSPKWSPDGTRIAAVTYAGGTLVTMRPDGSDVQVVGAGLLGEFDQGVEIDWGPA